MGDEVLLEFAGFDDGGAEGTDGCAAGYEAS